MKLLCYGDSNTYGYDPRGPIPGRYDADDRWCDLLAKQTGWTVINGGENGRIVPEPAWNYTDLKRMMREDGPFDAICIMLGTNDVLISSRMDVTPIVRHMEALLDFLKTNWPETKLVIVTPPPFDIPELPEANAKLETLIGLYHELVDRRELGFIDNHSWNIPLAFDGAHFSKQGHHVFAEHIALELISLFSQI